LRGEPEYSSKLHEALAEADALLGSVSTAVASRANIPVMIVPHHAAG